MTAIFQQALQAHQSHQLDEAERLYRAVLQAKPQHADAMSLLALVLGTKEQHDEAILWAQKAAASDPASPLFAFHLGTVLTNAKKVSEGIAAFRRALALKPDLPQAHYNMANALRAQDQWTEAIAAYREAIRLMPNYAEAYNNLALSLVHEKQFDEALTAAKTSVALEPRYGEGWRTLCNIAEQAKDYDLACLAGQKCTQLMPDSHFSWFGYGVALCRLNHYEEAISAYKRALELKPERADIWDNLGQTYQSLGRLDEAEATFHKTLEVADQIIPDEDSREVNESEYGNRHWHLALMELLCGKYKQGFARYRARFMCIEKLKRPNYRKPLWQGENLQGKTILINDEQGFGDTLMFCRYLPLLKSMGAEVKLSIHPALKPLLELSPSVDGIILHDAVLTHFDYYASVFDLPYRFGTTLKTIPNQVPFLPTVNPPPALAGLPINPPPVLTGLPINPPPVLTGGVRGGLPLRKIGVVWGGSPIHSNDSKRSVPLPCFADIFSETRAQFYSLNRDVKPGDAELLPRYPVIDLAPRITNFADAAGIIGQLDLVITCDTATAHLAGGLGKPVWILLPFAPDWRWLTDRDDSPWYPTARLFRQNKIGDWAGVIQRVKEALSSLIQADIQYR